MSKKKKSLANKEQITHSHSSRIYTEDELLRQWRSVSPPEMTMTLAHALSTVMETADVDRVLVKLSNEIDAECSDAKNDITTAEAKKLVYDFSQIFYLMEKKVKDSEKANLLFRLEFPTDFELLILRFKNIFKISDETALINC